MDNISGGMLHPEQFEKINRDQEKVIQEKPWEEVAKITAKTGMVRRAVEKGTIGPESLLWQEAEKFLDFVEGKLGIPIEKISLYDCVTMDRFNRNEAEYLSQKKPQLLFKTDLDITVLGVLAICIKEKTQTRQ